MLGVGKGELRPVEIPDSDHPDLMSNDRLLDRVFYYGQNDFQPMKDCYSVSVGDVAHMRGRFWLCQSVGWRELTNEEYFIYEASDRHSRADIARELVEIEIKPKVSNDEVIKVFKEFSYSLSRLKEIVKKLQDER
jgi:hypothetical protein